MVTCISHSASETEALGEGWGHGAERGWVIGLSGDLGTGKTQLVKGLARGLGITARVHSPTFALINVYPGGRLELCHLDLYRLDTPDQVIAAGLEEYLRPAGVTVIEWAERLDEMQSAECREQNGGDGGTPLASCVPLGLSRYRRVWIETLSETDRRIAYEDFGA
jgi:tRNA threonylcarbamoyladenosine biosynthesis protein TsaE